MDLSSKHQFATLPRRKFRVSSLINRSLLFLFLFSFSSCVFAQITTLGGGNWSSTIPGSPWPGGTIPPAGSQVIIASGHTVTLDVNTASLQSLTINAGGQLTTTSNFTVTATGSITVNGTYQNGSMGAITFGTLTVNGDYIHAIDGGSLPTPVVSVSWSPSSNCSITGITGTAPSGLVGQNFGNFIWNSPGQNANIYMEASFSVQRDFQVLDTGPLGPIGGALRMSNTPPPVIRSMWEGISLC